jgi:hypothetical protein
LNVLSRSNTSALCVNSADTAALFRLCSIPEIHRNCHL